MHVTPGASSASSGCRWWPPASKSTRPTIRALRPPHARPHRRKSASRTGRSRRRAGCRCRSRRVRARTRAARAECMAGPPMSLNGHKLISIAYHGPLPGMTAVDRLTISGRFLSPFGAYRQTSTRPGFEMLPHQFIGVSVGRIWRSAAWCHHLAPAWRHRLRRK
jgi:hypothetical protein